MAIPQTVIYNIYAKIRKWRPKNTIFFGVFIYYSLVAGYNFWVMNMINNVDFLLKFVKNNELYLIKKKIQWNNNFNTLTS